MQAQPFKADTDQQSLSKHPPAEKQSTCPMCRHCQYIYCPSITAGYLSALYQQGYHGVEDGAPKKGWADISFLTSALDRLNTEPPWQVLDFGTGQSLVPDILREQGHRVIATDVVAPVHPDRLTGDLRELKLEPEQFDLVFSFQVFEHLPDPKPMLDELFRLTRPAGLILIHTGMETTERKQGFSRWWYVAPQITALFTDTALLKYICKILLISWCTRMLNA